MIGCVYYVILTSDTTTQVKIGMSRNINSKRSSAHGQSSEIIREVSCGNPISVEKQLIKIFKKKFVKVKGNEFFKGDHDKMLECFDKCIETYATEAIEYNIDVTYLTKKIVQWFDQQLSQGIIPSIDDTHSFIRPDIESMISPQMMNCIDYLQSISDIAKMNEFIVHHEKLIEYGVCLASSGSNDIKKQLHPLGLSENEDYQLTKFRQPVKQGGFSIKHVYMLTPLAFKDILLKSKIKVYRSYQLFEQHLNQIYALKLRSYYQTRG